jgi:glycosyltransferase involved in cell wall biosynthesis
MEVKLIINARFLTQQTTGVQRFATEISRILKKQYNEIVFVAPHNIIQHEVAAELNVTIVGSNTGALWEQLDLPLYLKRNGTPLLVNFANTAPLLYTKQIVTIHDVAFKVNPRWFSKGFALFYNFLIPNIIKRSSAIITVSNFSKSEIIKYYKVPDNKVFVVYNGVIDFNGTNAKNSHGKYLLCVGSIDERKNLSTLISAFNSLNQTDLKLLITGDKNSVFNVSIDGKSTDNNNIVFTGRVSDEDLSSLYRNATMFIYPSLYEGFGIPPIEAMYFNCPTIVSDIPSLKETCGDASLYFQSIDYKDLKKKIALLINNNDLRERLIERGNINLKRFSWERSAHKVIDIINTK